ncbi:uncharacterized protein EV422DRAFT_500751 [Fimicolochytrium jonesii]|uniref:uncharacterized protein n=1 Tax=Fimicolochytrium jonesii TaxID=1396493 RepID=UPI0022FE641C|nr:uncharacterized protein EV422DRAFT_500751 [Fimicolochytrium jonesii]KAI8816851.1 hypothetical protein EV422DRAFT_500751 [Fimicolochytrium jonesii]
MPHTSCRHPRVRREFRELSEHDRERYILATVCLREQPSRLSTRETQWVRDGVGRKIAMPSLYDDFVYVHWRVAAETHGTPQFLPWHRIFISLYERALIRHCGWDEGIPFWDWSHDSQSPETSILWSARFYGRPTPSTPGSSPDSSPSSSHFIGASNFTHLFATWPSPHPIDRNWVQGPQGTLIPATFSPVELEMITGMARYGLFRSFLETLPHNLVHSGVGGDGGDFATAPTNPIFWLHHGNIDRHWARWQHHHLHIAHTYEGYPDSNNATVDDMMHYSGMYPDVPVRYALRYGNESNGYDEEGDVLPDAELLVS